MARYNFGGDMTAFAIQPPSGNSNVVKSQPNMTGSVYAARTGGSALTDLLDASGNPATGISSDTNGFVNRFQGPDGYNDLWADFGSGSRFHLRAVEGHVAKSAMPVNVKDYGATGDGSTDDRAAIQSALDAAGAGGTVFFPPGTYRLATATISGDRILKTYADQQWSGAGKYTSILKVGNTFGDYKTVVGMLNDSTYCGKWSIASMGINQNSTNGNALNIASMATYPRMAIRLGSYVANSVVAVENFAVIDSDNVNSLYVYGDVIEVRGSHFLQQGGAVGTGQHDHSSIYTTSTMPNSTQTITGNTFRGVKGSGGARTAIETHGGVQTVQGNAISSYFKGMNLTGVASTYPTNGISATGNVMDAVCIGIHLWSYYSGTLTSGTATRNVTVSNNTVTIDRDAWNSISSLLAYASGVLVDAGNTAPTEGLTITDNTVTYLPISGTPPTSDYHSTGINIDVTATAAEIRDLRIVGNVIVNPPSAGMLLNATVKRGLVAHNRVVDPGQSTEATITTTYRAGVVLSKTLEDVGFEGNHLIDTRGTHYSEYNIIATASLTAATNCWSRNNVTRYADGVGPRCAFFPAVSTAGAEFYIEEFNANGAVPSFNTKVGSKVTRTTTGQVLVQTTTAVGTAWKASLAQAATTGTTAPSAGGAGALPATPLGYITLNVNGTDRQVAYY